MSRIKLSDRVQHMQQYTWCKISFNVDNSKNDSPKVDTQY